MVTLEFETKTKLLIDGLKGICASAGLGNDGNEFKIITQIFLYKFLNDKFAYDVKRLNSDIKEADSWENEISKLSQKKFDLLLRQLPPDTARLKPEHFISC